jgi:hypothetical protein
MIKKSIFVALIAAVALYFYNFSGDDVSTPANDPSKPTVEEMASAKAKDPHYLDIGFLIFIIVIGQIENLSF